MPNEPSAIRDLEATLDHEFRDVELLVRALTHRSLARETAEEMAREAAEEARNRPKRAGEDNERLEFLGDAVLNLAVAETLFAAHPEWREGELTRVRSRLVSRQNMARVAESIALGQHLRLGKGEERAGLRRKSSVLSDCMEAVLGALFLDGGLEAVRAFARRRVTSGAVEQLAAELESGAALGNYKSALQERLQATGAGAPIYHLKSESGPPHRRRFLVEVRLNAEADQPLARGSGSTKKRAEQDAARRALDRLAEGQAGRSSRSRSEGQQ